MEIRDLLKLIRKSYEATSEIPRFYRDFFSFLNVVNQNLSECGEPLMDEESLKYIILSNYKKAKFIENYQFDNEDKNLHYSSPLALYISYQPQLSEEHIQKYQKDICGAIVNSNLNEDNWYTLDYLVQVMKYLGINYKDLGFLRITDFLYEVFPEYQSKKDGNTDYGYIEATRYAEKTENRTIDIPLSNKKTKKKKSIDILSEFACFPGENFYSAYLYAIRQLAQMALPEHWYYGHNDPGTYPILRNYFLMTFIRVQSEKKILKNENYAVLNTGLVDKLYEPIYAFLKRIVIFLQEVHSLGSF